MLLKYIDTYQQAWSYIYTHLILGTQMYTCMQRHVPGVIHQKNNMATSGEYF